MSTSLKHSVQHSLLLVPSAILCVFLLAGHAFAQPFETWGTSGDWSIKVDTSVGNGCFIERQTPEDLKIRLGYLPDRVGAFISASSVEWSDLEVGSAQTVTMFLDDAVFAGETELFQDGDAYGGLSFFNNPDFLKEFAKKRSMTIVDPNGDKARFDLTGTANALKSLDKCQTQQSR